MPSGVCCRLVIAALLCAVCPAAVAFTAKVGFERLASELGDDLPTGRDVRVGQIEPAADDSGRSGPARDDRRLEGVRFHPLGADVTWGSRHATRVATLFYGRGRAMAPGVRDVHVGTPVQFMEFLRRWPDLPAGARPNVRVWNHSWVGGRGQQLHAALRRIDEVAYAQEWILVCGVPNKGRGKPLMASAYNVLSVGMSNGRHAKGAVRVSSRYHANRARPHLVAPMQTSSASVPLVSAAAALLVEAGSDPALSRDTVESFRLVNGERVYNAQRARVVSAALMAGARRNFAMPVAPGAAAQPAYRERAAHRTDNGLDRRFGAGQLDVYHAWHVVAAGEFDSREDNPRTADAAATGFDFDPSFGGLGGSNRQAVYEFEAGASGAFTAALLWPATVDDGKVSVPDLNLTLADVTDSVRRVAHSTSRRENGEHVYAQVESGRRYQLLVSAGADEPDFESSYALAWRLAGD